MAADGGCGWRMGKCGWKNADENKIKYINKKRQNTKLRRLATVFLALGWIFSNQYLAWKTCFDFHHTRPPFQSMIKFYVLVGFQATVVTIAMVTQSTSF